MKPALVLAGGAARGAYEVGVVHYLVQDVARAIGRDVPLDILCGTSVGALNVCGLAAFADEPKARADRMADVWRSLRVADLVKTDLRGLFAGSRALLHTSGLEKLIADSIPFEKIADNVANGAVSAVTVSTTHVQSGKTVVFVQRAGGGLPPWSHDPTIEPRAATLNLKHALASASIPVLFRAVLLDGEYHCDGGLRQNVPLSPARRLGADRLLIVNPRHIETHTLPEHEEEPSPGPFLLLGKTLNALLLDRLDTDLARLEGINNILAAGTRRFGPQFLDAINAELGHPEGRGIRPLRALLIRASEDIGKLSVDFVRSPRFETRVKGPLSRVMRRLADGEGSESDLLSYLLFDGEFAGELIERGRADARARHDELCAFFASA
jgi:NTE family protein